MVCFIHLKDQWCLMGRASEEIIYVMWQVPTTPACTWWNRPEEDPSSGKLESTHPSRTSVKYDQVFFGVESIMRVNAASLDIRDAFTSTPGTLNDLTTDLIMANNNNVMWRLSEVGTDLESSVRLYSILLFSIGA